MTQVVPFESANLPAELLAAFGPVTVADDLTSGVGGGFPTISIKGKVFHIVRGDDRTMVTMPDNPEQPSGSIEVVILKANPGLSKVFYEGGYVEGSEEKPKCYSNDGVTPANDAQEKQSLKCATCANNVWGSRISENGSKVKACTDSRRLAVAPSGQVNDAMLLRVPAASLAPLAQYGDTLKKRGVPYQAVITRVSFDFTVAHPALKFAPVGFVPADVVPKIMTTMAGDMVAKIVGDMPVRGEAPQVGTAPTISLPPAASTAPAPQPTPAPVVAAPAPAKPKPAAAKPKPPAPTTVAAPAPQATSAFFSGAPAAPAPVAPPPQPTPAPVAPMVIDTGDLDQQLDAVLAGAGFDDAA